ncbi:SGNH/GDSL hydrolase family protein [Entomohabitans teleogrylli]|uniref:SGNH/GDSL hydrolase family protein n=1 Tax=Entomohabitans teleogrylli TaxID=1384589 RepID=UPI000AC8B780|nr:SGNH/GDSL hydrolase family protein [Entomohabitans teleogrylli]
MSTLNDENIWVEEIYQLEEDTPVLGGPGGPDNRQAQQLANRTRYLKNLITGLPDFREFTFYKSVNDPDGTIAGLAATPEGQLFRVALGAGTEPAFIYYRNDSGVAIAVAYLASQRSVDLIHSLIRGYSNEETIYEKLTDEEGGLLRQYSDKEIFDLHHRIRSNPSETVLGGDEEGGALIRANGETVDIGPLRLRYSTLPGLRVIDDEGGILRDLSDPGDAPGPSEVRSVLDGGVYFGSRTLAAFSGEKQVIHIPSVLSERLAGRDVLATISSSTTPAQASGRNTLEVIPSDYGSAAVLNFRTDASVSDRRGASVKMVSVPDASVATTIKILMIGDSIGNRQGPQLISQFLSTHGYTAQFIGTLNTSASASTANDATGAMAECREGWESGDFTGAITDRISIIRPGDEAMYMAQDKTTKWPQNPFLRVSIESDSTDIIRNGWVMDFAFYQERFSLETPDVVIYGAGTNDVRDRTVETIYSDVLNNELLLMRQLRAAWPSARVIRMLPGTSMDAERNELWSTKYVPVLRAMNAAARVLTDGRQSIVPTWALVNHDNGYSTSYSNIDAETGFGVLNWGDNVHPIGASRHLLYKSLAPYVAASYLNLL